MHKGKYVFAQLLDFIHKDVFLKIANKYDGNRYVKHFTCWNQLAVLMFGQPSNRESLWDVVLATQAHSFYIFDRDHNDFKRLYRINVLNLFFFIRSKSNLKYKIVK